MSQDLLDVVNVLDELATIVSEIRLRQMHTNLDRTARELSPIKDKLATIKNKLEKQLIQSEEQPIISR